MQTFYIWWTPNVVFCAAIFRSGTDLIGLLILLGWPLQKSLRRRRFRSDRDEIWQHCSSSKYVSTDGVGFLIWCHSFKVAAIRYFMHQSAATWWIKTKHLPRIDDATAAVSSWSIFSTFILVSAAIFNCLASKRSVAANHMHCLLSCCILCVHYVTSWACSESTNLIDLDLDRFY